MQLRFSILDQFLLESQDSVINCRVDILNPVQVLYKSVQRDLEYLLNSRRPNVKWPELWSHLDQSLVAYGICDITATVLNTQSMQKELCDEWCRTIKKFEPRLKDVTVRLLSEQKFCENILYLKIEALLISQALLEPIVFASIFEAGNNRFTITELVG